MSQETLAEVCPEAAVSWGTGLLLWPALPSRDGQTFSKAAVERTELCCVRKT